MKVFNMPSPRRFEHKYIYVNERKERLKKIEDNAKRELGLLPPEETTYEERIRGAFVGEGSHLQRRKEYGKRFSTRTLIVAIAIALFILHYLLTGNWSF